MNNDDDDGGGIEQRAEEFYNCGYDGLYEQREKAIIFECVGRGLKLPPLSQIYVPPFLLNRHQNQAEGVRPSHHILELLSPAEAPPQESSLNGKQTNKPNSWQRDVPGVNDDVHSESSDLDVYISDEDGATTDEPDRRPALTDFQVQNSEMKAFLPVSLVCKAECSPSGNKIVTEIDPFRNSFNEKDDCVTSDEEIFSNPSSGEDSESDNEVVSAATNNLNMTVSYKLNRDDSPNNLDTAANRSVQNIPLGEDLCVESTSAAEVRDSLQKAVHRSGCSDPSEELHVEENLGTEVDGRGGSSSSNSYRDPVDDMFSSEESEENYFVNHFRTFRGEGAKLDVESAVEFPDLPTKQGQNRQMKCQAQSLPESQLKIKNIAKLILSNPTDADMNVRSGKSSADQRDLEPSHPELLVIENLPQNVNKEYLMNFLQQFGKVKNITMIPFPDKVTARIHYEIGVELDWIIHCLNGNAIFGAESQTLRCYRE